MDHPDLALMKITNLLPSNMKNLIIVVCFLICFITSNLTFAFDTRNKSNEIEREIVELINRLDEVHGNVYILDQQVPFKLSNTSKEYNEILGVAYEVVKTNKIPWSPVDYSKITIQFQSDRVKDPERFQREVKKQIVLDEVEKQYAKKVDKLALDHANLILVEPPLSDSINNLFALVDNSVNATMLHKKALRTEKKLFKLNSVYASNELILIIYSLNFGYPEDNMYVELVLR